MSLKAMVNNRDAWDELCAFLDDKIKAAQTSMETQSESVAIYRLQGQILALRRLKYMRDELNGSK